MRIVRWMCGIKLKDRFPSKELSNCMHAAEVQANKLPDSMDADN